MAQPPAYLYYYKEFMASTLLWTDEEVGAYQRALNYQAANGPMSRDELEHLVKPHLTRVLAKFVKNNGKWFNRKLYSVIKDREAFYKNKKLNDFQHRGAIVTVNGNVSCKKGEFEGEESLVGYWLSKKNLVRPRKITAQITARERAVLKEYSFDELCQCVDAYDQVMGSEPETYFGQYPHAFAEFFRAGDRKPAPYVKFLPERDPLNNLRKNKGGRKGGFDPSRMRRLIEQQVKEQNGVPNVGTAIQPSGVSVSDW